MTAEEALVVDLTKCYPTHMDLSTTLDRAEDERERRGISIDSLFFLGRSDQRLGVTHRFPKADWQILPSDDSQGAMDALEHLLNSGAVNGRFGRVLVLTFHRQVLTECSALSSPSLIVDAKPFSAIPKRERPTQGTAQPILTEQVPESTAKPKSFAFEDAIRNRGLGPFSRVRGLVWDELEQRFPQAPQKPFRELLTECVTTAVTGDFAKSLVLSSVRDSLMKLLIKAEVVKDSGGRPLGRGLSGSRSPVAELDPEFRVKTDAELVLVVLEAFSALGYSERRELAGALYHSKSLASVEKVDQLLGYLLDEKRIEEVEKDEDDVSFRLVRPFRQDSERSLTATPFTARTKSL